MPLYTVANGSAGNAADLDQLVQSLVGALDGGAMSLLTPVSAPSAAPAVTLAAGSVTGTGYQWGTYWITGIPDGTGAYHVTGRTTISPLTAAQSMSAQEATVSIAGESLPTGVVGWGVVRNQSAGATWYEVPGSEQFLSLAGAMPTTYVDDTADADLVTPAPSSNTTGTSMEGIFSLSTGSAVPAGETLAVAGSITGAGDVDMGGPATFGGPLTPNGGIAGALGAAGLAYYPGNPVGPNLIFNSSWRLAAAGWEGIGAHSFSISVGGVEGTFLYATTSSATLVQVDNGGQTPNCMVPAYANETYTLSGDMMSSSITAGGMALQWYAFNASGTPISGGSVQATNGQYWERYSVSFTAPAGTAFLQIACYYAATIATGGNVAWRRLKLEGGPVATPYTAEADLWPYAYPNVLIPGLNAQQWGGAANDVTYAALTATYSATSIGAGQVVSTGLGVQLAPSTSRTRVGASVTLPTYSGADSFPDGPPSVMAQVYRSTVGVPAAGSAPNGGDVAVGSILIGGSSSYTQPVSRSLDYLDTGVAAGTTYYYYIAISLPLLTSGTGSGSLETPSTITARST